MPSTLGRAEDTVANAAVTGLIDGGQDPPFSLVSSTGVADELRDVRTPSGLPVNQLDAERSNRNFSHDMPKKVDAYETIPAFWTGFDSFLNALASSKFESGHKQMNNHVVRVADTLGKLHDRLIQRSNDAISKTYLLEMSRCLSSILEAEQEFQELQLDSLDKLLSLKQRFEKQKMRMCKHESFAWDLETRWQNVLRPSIEKAVQTDPVLHLQKPDDDWTIHTLNKSSLSKLTFPGFNEEESQRIIQCNFKSAQREGTSKKLGEMRGIVKSFKHLFELREWLLELYILLSRGPTVWNGSRTLDQLWTAEIEKLEGHLKFKFTPYHFHTVYLLRRTERLLNQHHHFGGKPLWSENSRVAEMSQDSLRQIEIIQKCLLSRISLSATNLTSAMVYLQNAKFLLDQWSTGTADRLAQNCTQGASLPKEISKLSRSNQGVRENQVGGEIHRMKLLASMIIKSTHAVMTLFFNRTLQHSKNMTKGEMGSTAASPKSAVLHRFKDTLFDYQSLFSDFVEKQNYTLHANKPNKTQTNSKVESQVYAFIVVDYDRLQAYRNDVMRLVYATEAQPPHERHEPAVVTQLGAMNCFDFNQFDVAQPSHVLQSRAQKYAAHNVKDDEESDVEPIDGQAKVPMGVDRWRIMYSYPDQLDDTSGFLFRYWPNLVSILLRKADEISQLQGKQFAYENTHKVKNWQSRYFISEIDSAMNLVVMYQFPNSFQINVQSLEESTRKFSENVSANANFTNLFSRQAMRQMTVRK